MLTRLGITLGLIATCTTWASRSDAAGCVPGAQVECACAGGAKGVQLCADDGKKFEKCRCEEAPKVKPEQVETPAPKAKEEQPAAARTGGIHVGAGKPGKVVVDGEDKGATPLELKDLKPGTYRVRVELEDGTLQDEDIEVVAGETQRMFVEPSTAFSAGRARAGTHFGFSVGGGGWLGKFEKPGGYGMAAGFANIGLSKGMDLRFGVAGMVGTVQRMKTVVLFGVTGAARFNLGSVYTIWIGGMLGVHHESPEVEVQSQGCSTNYDRINKSETGVLVSPELSVATFRFGSRREFEFSLSHGLAVPVTKSQDVGTDDLLILYNTVTFSMLLL
jgi:hypothetical protein